MSQANSYFETGDLYSVLLLGTAFGISVTITVNIYIKEFKEPEVPSVGEYN